MNRAIEEIWRWSPSLTPYLRHPFPGIEFVAKNQSQAWQDLFVLTVLRGLRGGRYLEVGSQEPVSNNNTFLLDKEFGWSGVSIEIDPQYLTSWAHYRPDSTLVIADALEVNYRESLPLWFGVDSDRIDYLQLDIDPSINTLRVLERLPLEHWRFSVITFETDAYTNDSRAQEASRDILSAHGYVMVAADVSVVFPPVSPDPIPFEDWWVDPQVVDADLISNLLKLNSEARLPQFLLFGETAPETHWHRWRTRLWPGGRR